MKAVAEREQIRKAIIEKLKGGPAWKSELAEYVNKQVNPPYGPSVNTLKDVLRIMQEKEEIFSIDSGKGVPVWYFLPEDYAPLKTWKDFAKKYSAPLVIKGKNDIGKLVISLGNIKLTPIKAASFFREFKQNIAEYIEAKIPNMKAFENYPGYSELYLELNDMVQSILKSTTQPRND